jgi:ribosomal-protein-alanine N-acetyltransferase
MTAEDLPAVMEIEEGAYKFPWSRKIFTDCMRVGYSCLVAEDGDEVVGYAIMSAAVGEAHLLNLCVKTKRQGCGVGTFLLGAVAETAKQKNAHTLYLEVRPSNTAAVNLYYKFGFYEIGTRKNYYPSKHGREDASILALML